MENIQDGRCGKTCQPSCPLSMGRISAASSKASSASKTPRQMYTKKTGPALRYFANYHDSKVNAKSFKLTCQDSICNRFLQFRGSVNSLESRLKAKQCELCGSTTADRYELHHVHKVKDLKGKAEWERCMIAKRRKTLVV